MKGQVELKTPWGRKEVPFTREGRVPLTRLVGYLAIPGILSMTRKVPLSDH